MDLFSFLSVEFNRRLQDAGEEGCFEAFPGPSCGTAGRCEVINETETCTCAPGWEINQEMAIYFIDEDLIPKIGLCNFNEALLYILYGVALIVNVAIILLTFCRVTKRKQCMRLVPSVLESVIVSILLLYRLSNLKEAVFGKDFFFTIVWAYLHIFTLTTSLSFYDSYVNAVLDIGYIIPSYGRIVRFLKLKKFMICYDLVTYNLFWVSMIVPRGNLAERNVGLFLIKLSFFLQTLRVIHSIALAEVVLGPLSKEFFKIDAARSNLEVLGESRKKKSNILRAAKTLKSLRKGLHIYNLAWCILMGTTAFLDYWLYFYSYVIPIFALATCLAVLSTFPKKVPGEKNLWGHLNDFVIEKTFKSTPN